MLGTLAMNNNLPTYSSFIEHWNLNQDIVYLNHGSFGATPKFVLKKQQQIHAEMEAEAVDFYINHLPNLLQESKQSLSNFVGADANDLVFVQNTTTGVNTILNSLQSNENDDWLITNHNYGACVHALKHYAKRNKCNVVCANIPYPLHSDDDILKAIENTITPKTTIALIDYITSATAIIFPIKKIIEMLHQKGIKVIIDAAHAPGMVDFSIDDLKPDFFVANCHKWICSPKGSAFMYVSKELQSQIFPLVISHYNNEDEGNDKHWSNQFLWDGTHDYSSYLGVKDALEFMPTLMENDWIAIKRHNHDLAWKASSKIANSLNKELPAPENMIGSIVNIPMPNSEEFAMYSKDKKSLKEILFEKYSIEVPIFLFPSAPNQWLRISAQLYNSMEQYDYLIDCLKKELKF